MTEAMGWTRSTAIRAAVACVSLLAVTMAAPLRADATTEPGTIFTLAGGPPPSAPLGDGGPARSASLGDPQGVAVDPIGDVIIADTEHNVIRMVASRNCTKDCAYGVSATTRGDIYTIAGGGTATRNGVKATATKLNQPQSVDVDPQGNVLIADTQDFRVMVLAANTCRTDCGYGLRGALAKGSIYAVAGTGTPGFSGDGGLATSASIGEPHALALDSRGNLFIADATAGKIRMVASNNCRICFGLIGTESGHIYTVAGGGAGPNPGDGGPAVNAFLFQPNGLARDVNGNLLIADGSGAIRVVAGDSCAGNCPYGLPAMTAGSIYKLAGTYGSSFAGDGGPAVAATLWAPSAVAADASGNVLISDWGNGRIRMIAAADCAAACPYGLPATVHGDIYTVAGTGEPGEANDRGPATLSAISSPGALAAFGPDRFLIAEAGNQRIRLVAPGNTLRVSLAGKGKGYVRGGEIQCPGMCTSVVATGVAYGLIAKAIPGSVFTGWSGGGCSGTAGCGVVLAGDQTVTASFAPVRTVTIHFIGSGHGRVTGGGINCPGTCRVRLADGVKLTLHAKAKHGSTFFSWGSAQFVCPDRPTCTIKRLNDDATFHVEFDRSQGHRHRRRSGK